MGIARNLRRLARKQDAAAVKQTRRKAMMEPLEPRLLLSADISYTLGDPSETLKLFFDDVTDQIVLMEGSETRASAAIHADGEINLSITGTDQANTVSLLFENLDDLANHSTLAFTSLNILFDGLANPDQLTISGDLYIPGVDLSITGIDVETLKVASGVSISADDITLTTSHENTGDFGLLTTLGNELVSIHGNN